MAIFINFDPDKGSPSQEDYQRGDSYDQEHRYRAVRWLRRMRRPVPHGRFEN